MIPLIRIATVAAIIFAIQASAQPFPEPHNSERDKSSPPTATDAASSFELPDGFQVSVLASEPQVQNPIAMTWDHRGRMWVAENFTYAERNQRFEMGLHDRVLIFEDTNHDGIADTRKAFIDSVQVLTSVEVGHDGVWLMCPPQLLFVPDRNHDDVPDSPPEVVLDGFTVAKNNHHNFANGLRWGPDGWLYGRCGHSCPGKLGIPGTPDSKRVPMDGGIWRFHPKRKVVEVLTHGTTNPWGHDWDRHGELFFINTVNGHLWHATPGAHFREPFGQSQNPLVYERIGMHADHWHFDTAKGWTKSRAGKAKSFGGGHAHVGMMIYQADHLPQSWRNRLFTWNIHGFRANVERLERHGSGYIGKHEPDVFVTSDKWFRGIEISTGPGGAIYALDWSDIGECHESTGVHRKSGRIFRFTHGTPSKPDYGVLEKLDNEGISEVLRHPNVWYYRQALQRLPAELPPAAHKTLASALANDTDTVVRLRALWMLHAADHLTDSHLMALLNDKDEHIRVWAVRFLVDAWPLDSLHGPMAHVQHKPDKMVVAHLVKLAQRDPSGLVRLTLASTLQRLPIDRRPALAQALAARAEDAKDHNLPAMVWYGLFPLVKTNPNALVSIAKTTNWPQLLNWISRSLADNADARDNLLSAAVADTAKAQHILAGLSTAYRGRRKEIKPNNWTTVEAKLGQREETVALVRNLGILFGTGRALDELKTLVADGKADIAIRKNALQTLIENRATGLREICERHLKTRGLNTVAIRGLAVFDDPAIGIRLANSYRRFRPSERPAVIDVLCSRAEWALALLSKIDAGVIPRQDLTAFHARQLIGFGDEKLSKRVREVWGDVRSSNVAKRQQMTTMKAKLTPAVLAEADLHAGRQHFATTCASCHQLYGAGGKLGPDLTGAQRGELDYLLENIIDPSGVVSATYRMTTLTLKDGRTLSGVIAASTDRSLTLRQLTEETVIDKQDVSKRADAPLSIMPEGLLSTLTSDQVRDLIAYLMHPRQVPAPK